MTCFWNAILTSLCDKDFKPFGVSKMNNTNFVKFLQKNNKKPENVTWNGHPLTPKELEENFTHIKDFNVNSIMNGYDCSVCDPFLILISELFNISIQHKYLKTIIQYTNSKATRLVKYGSNHGHFFNQ